MSKKNQNQISIFGVKIFYQNELKIKDRIKKELESGKKCFFITTLNPEILLKAEKNKTYKKILNTSSLKIIDGFGIKLLVFLKRKKIGERLTGVDLAKYILNQAKLRDLKVALITKENGLSKKEDLHAKIADLGLKNFIIEKINIQNTESQIKSDLTNLEDINVLLVGLGAPYQEEFIWKIKPLLPNLKLAMGVGGTFDFWTGKQKRAPKFIRKFGLEWLWRLFKQPNRFIRIWNATGVFLWRSLIRDKSLD